MLFDALLDGSVGKESTCKARDAGDAEDVSLIPGWRKSPGEEMGIHSTSLAWKLPRTEEPGGLQSMGQQRVGHGWGLMHTHMVFDIVTSSYWIDFLF